MRKVFLLLILFVTGYASAQNLVPNPSFEDTVACPYDLDLISYSVGWNSFRGTADYYNLCSQGPNVAVPKNLYGYQFASTGISYAGILTWDFTSNYREVLARQLSTPMVIGTKYYISMKVSLSNLSQFATDKLGFSFSTIAYSSGNEAAINNSAIINVFAPVTDTVNWVLAAGSFVSDSAYEYVMIANFFDDDHTDTIRVPLDETKYSFFESYYYIDDVCVSPDSATCNNGTGIKLIPSTEFNIYPNPANDKIYLSINFNGNYSYSLLNLLGEEIKSSPSSGASALDVTDVHNGIYILRISYQNKTIQRKLVVCH